MRTREKSRFWISFWSIEHVRMQYSVDALPNNALFLLFGLSRLGFGLARLGLARVYCMRFQCDGGLRHFLTFGIQTFIRSKDLQVQTCSD